MEEEFHLRGSGGQGLLLMGLMLAYSGMHSGLEVSWIPSYGAERRGGTSFCGVTLADHEISCPLTDLPDLLLAMDNRAMTMNQDRLRVGGLLLTNQTLVTKKTTRNDVETVELPISRIAEEMKAPFAANMVALGAILALKPIIPLKAVQETLPKVLGAKKAKFVPVNWQAIQKGHAAMAAIRH